MHLDPLWSEPFREKGERGRLPVLTSAKHLAWVRKRPCLVSRAPSGDSVFTHVDSHHLVPKSRGANDYTAIPLVHRLHMEGHQQGWQAFEEKHGLDLKDALIATLIERIWELEHGIR